jgi:hypothetical protein
VLPELPTAESPEFSKDKKKHRKYVGKAVKSQEKDPKDINSPGRPFS